jgi:hypothetical protein
MKKSDLLCNPSGGVDNNTFHFGCKDKRGPLTPHAVFEFEISKKMAEVYVEKSTAFCNHDVIGVAVTNTKNMGRNAVTCASLKKALLCTFILRCISVMLQKK